MRSAQQHERRSPHRDGKAEVMAGKRRRALEASKAGELSAAEIARQLGLDPTTVNGWIREAGR